MHTYELLGFWAEQTVAVRRAGRTAAGARAATKGLEHSACIISYPRCEPLGSGVQRGAEEGTEKERADI
jgi:hypothetical protein